ncbi:hypothetical protein E1263_15965 [Kribbella antibiotica]|uniref:Uncharacterized protein n=1 Tax=Kribbella antibiotica TaxID=190195 RepID=A0A4R4ZKB1_9ACTN|nr:hypothetical protein E1263_15965 [Kribbella antibiotica]
MSLFDAIMMWFAVTAIRGADPSGAIGGGLAAVLVVSVGVGAMRYLDRRMADARFLVGVAIALGRGAGQPLRGLVQRVVPTRYSLHLGPGGADLLDALPYLQVSLAGTLGATPAVDPNAGLKAADSLFAALREQAVSGSAVVATAELKQAIRAVLGRLDPEWVQLREVAATTEWIRAGKISSPARRMVKVMTAAVAAVTAITGLLQALK